MPSFLVLPHSSTEHCPDTPAPILATFLLPTLPAQEEGKNQLSEGFFPPQTGSRNNRLVFQMCLNSLEPLRFD